MTPAEDLEFTAFLIQKADQAVAAGYYARRFKEALAGRGALATVRQLLTKGHHSDGLTRLWEFGRLDLSIEAIFVETAWGRFIDPALVRHAERVLKGYKYDVRRFAGATSASSHPTTAPTAAIESPPRPSTRKNTRSFSAFCAWLGAPLKNVANRWCGYAPARGMAVVTLWADVLHGDRYILWDAARRAGDTRIGAIELRQVLADVMAAGHALYGIRCEAKDPVAKKRERGHFDKDEILVLRLSVEGADVVAQVMGTVLAADVAAGRPGVQRSFESALDDLAAPPPGQAAPPRLPTAGGSGYRWDSTVRNYVLRRAWGLFASTATPPASRWPTARGTWRRIMSSPSPPRARTLWKT